MAVSSLKRLDSNQELQEYIKFYNSSKPIKGKGVEAKIKIMSFIEDKYFIHFIPSLNISSYGDSFEESEQMLKESLDSLFDILLNLKQDLRDAEMSELGWDKQLYSRRKYTGPYIDKKGILKEFNISEDTLVQEEILEIA